MNNMDPNATKYLVKAKLTADGIVDKPDVVGAIFGQTEGLLGDELDLRDLQKSGRIGRIEVEVTSKGGKSEGNVTMSSSLDQVETSILAAALETIDRVGPCKAGIKVLGIEDVRVSKREQVIERAKELLGDLLKTGKTKSSDITETVKHSVQVDEITTYGKDRCPAGPNVKDSESIIIVEGRSDVLNCLRAGIKNAIAVEGTSVPETVQELSKEKVTTAFVDGDRGGELILRELFQVAEIDFVARAPRAHEVEELTTKQLVKCLRNKISGDQYMQTNGLTEDARDDDEREEPHHRDRFERRELREDRHGRFERREERHGRDRDDDRRRDRDDERHPREERELRKPRFDRGAVERFKRKDETEEVEPEPVAEPEVEAPVEEEKPKRTRKPREPKADSDAPKTLGRKKKEAARETKELPEEYQKYRDLLLDMASTHNAKALDAEGNIKKEVAVKNLVDSLKEDSEGITTIVFDGVISQRIIDVSSEKGISIVVGTRKGNITKMAKDIKILTKEDLY